MSFLIGAVQVSVGVLIAECVKVAIVKLLTVVIQI